MKHEGLNPVADPCGTLMGAETRSPQYPNSPNETSMPTDPQPFSFLAAAQFHCPLHEVVFIDVWRVPEVPEKRPFHNTGIR